MYFMCAVDRALLVCLCDVVLAPSVAFCLQYARLKVDSTFLGPVPPIDMSSLIVE